MSRRSKRWLSFLVLGALAFAQLNLALAACAMDRAQLAQMISQPTEHECCDEAEQAGARRAIRLRVSGAFHSPLVERAAERLRPTIERVHFKEPLAPFVSTVTARLETAQRYRTLLVEQLTAPVRFTQAASELVRNGVTIFVEVGPGNVLSGLLKRIDTRVRVMSVSNLRSLDELEQALEQ